MPELPEVETVARTLAPQVCGRRIAGISVLNAGTWQGGTAAGEVESLNPRIRGVGRRGKLLLLHFGEGGAEAGENVEEISVPTCAEQWPLFYSAVFYLVFNGILTIIFGHIEKKLSYFKV